MPKRLCAMTIRTYRPGDEAHVATIWNRSLPSDPMAADRLYRRILADPGFAPEGLIIAERDGRPTGFLWAVARGGTGWIVAFAVDPSRRREGIGRALVAAGFGHLRTRACTQAICSSYAPGYFWPGPDVEAHAGAVELLKGFGFATVEEVVAMECRLPATNPPAESARSRLAAEGFWLGEMAPGRVVPAGRFIERHFSPDWAEAVRHAVRTGVPAQQIRIAARGDEVVGFALWGAYDDSPDRFGPFGVDPALRGRGLGSCLLHDALHAMAQAGRRTAWFLWTEPDGAAFRLYRRAGFAVTRRFAMMRASLGSAGQSSG